jgi:hypothetical protein
MSTPMLCPICLEICRNIYLVVSRRRSQAKCKRAGCFSAVNCVTSGLSEQRGKGAVPFVIVATDCNLRAILQYTNGTGTGDQASVGHGLRSCRPRDEARTCDGPDAGGESGETVGGGTSHQSRCPGIGQHKIKALVSVSQ